MNRTSVYTCFRSLSVYTCTPGTLDSSGMRMWYTSTPREHEAGILQIGHSVHPFHMIPPNVANFTTIGITTSRCTERVRENKLRMFVFHGISVVLSKRWNSCLWKSAAYTCCWYAKL